MTDKNNIKRNASVSLEQEFNDFVKAVVELFERNPKRIVLEKEFYINVQNQINAYLKQSWVSTDRKKIANQLIDSIKKFERKPIPLQEISRLLVNAQNEILQQDRKKLIYKKNYSRLHQVIAGIIENINFYSKLESQLDEVRVNRVINKKREAFGLVKLVTEGKVSLKNKPQLLPEPLTRRSLKGSAKLIRGCFKPFYKESNANRPNKLEEMETTAQQTMPVLNSRG